MENESGLKMPFAFSIYGDKTSKTKWIYSRFVCVPLFRRSQTFILPFDVRNIDDFTSI